MVRDTMALRATEEPRLIRLMTMPKRKETMTALRGTGEFGETCRVVIRKVRLCYCQWGLVLYIGRGQNILATTSWNLKDVLGSS